MIEVRDIAETRRFCQEALGCLEGPSKEELLDFNLYGYRILCRLNTQLGRHGVAAHYELADGKYVRRPRCSVPLEMTEWEALAERLKRHGVRFVIKPSVPSNRESGERATLVLQDPSGNAIEFKSFCHRGQHFVWRARKRAIRRWVPWVLLATFVSCGILLELQKSEDDIGVNNSDICTGASSASCVPATELTPQSPYGGLPVEWKRY